MQSEGEKMEKVRAQLGKRKRGNLNKATVQGGSNSEALLQVGTLVLLYG